MDGPESPGWKTKLFGDNRTNFYGWILGGLFVIGISLWFVFLAIQGWSFTLASLLRAVPQ